MLYSNDNESWCNEGHTTHPAAVKKHLAESQKYATDEGLWGVFIVVIAAGCSSWLVTSFLMIVSLCLRFANCSKTLNVHDTLHLTRMQTKQPLYFIPHRFYYFMFHISDERTQTGSDLLCLFHWSQNKQNTNLQLYDEIINVNTFMFHV